MKQESEGQRAPMTLLESESQMRFGPVAAELDGAPVLPGRYRISGDSFVLATPSGFRFRYQVGQGVICDPPEGYDPAEVELWRNGSVYSAIAALNGLRPLHASAISAQGQAIAFTGPEGAGKSTLLAGLCARGVVMFCDDTLVLDLSDPAHVTALPGHKRLKLADAAFAITGLAREERVAPDVAKHYAYAPMGSDPRPLPLRALIFLETGDELSLARLTGAERFARLDDGHYTTRIAEAAGSRGRDEVFAARARLASQIEMYRLVRPFDLKHFAAVVALVMERFGITPGNG